MADEIVIGDLTPVPAATAVLTEAPPLDLPRGAELNPDGSVTMTLDYPVTLKFRLAGSDAVTREEPVTQLVLRRLTGADVRKMIGAKNPSTMALSLSSGLGLAKLHTLQNVMDASDDAAAAEIVNELLGGFAAGLPAHADETPEGITLPLMYPAADEDGTVRTEISFKRLTAVQRRQAGEAPNLLDWGASMATDVSPKTAKTLVDAMDGADAMAVNRVVLFLCGSGRRSGR